MTLVASKPAKRVENDLLTMLKSALKKGKSFDLSHCCYGPPTGKRISFIDEPMPYYYLLAGLAYTIKARQGKACA